ncbi:MAG: type IX secretion system membrane protein PorP/SprF, partial [Bacteroidota bacterium]|nr:type IX secretion system membrane protein PorP/SprF [Bacteroidota bacterium]
MNPLRPLLLGSATVWVALLCLGGLRAQDAQLTQFYAAAPHLNPAFAGGTLENRVAFHYRNQWPGLPGRFVSYGASYDVFIPKINSGIGVIFSSDEAGTGALG